MNASTEYYVDFLDSRTGDLGVMIISKYPIIHKSSYFAEDSIFYARQTEIVGRVGDTDVNIVGLYVPSRDRREENIY